MEEVSIPEYKILIHEGIVRRFTALCLYCDQETIKYKTKYDACESVKRHISVLHKRLDIA